MSYQDTSKHLQETLHIERQLKTYPEWIMYTYARLCLLLYEPPMEWRLSNC